MNVPVVSPSATGGGFRVGLVLSAVLFVLLLSGPRPSGAAVSAAGFPVATSPENETSAAVGGNNAVWSVSGAGGADVQGKNLSTGLGLPIPGEPGAQIRPAADGRIVVWEDASSGDSDVYGFDLLTLQKFPVAVGAGNQARPSVGGGMVVWEDDRNGDYDVYAYDLGREQEVPVTTAPGDQRNPDVDGDTVVWEDRDAADSDVVSKNLRSGGEKAVATGPDWQDSPAVGDGRVVWRESTAGDLDVRGYDLAAERGIEVGAGSGDQYAPAVGSRVAVWVHEAGGNADVRGRDLSTGEAFVVAGGPGQQENPAVGGETVVWEVQREGESGFGTFDLQGARLDLAPVAPAGLAAAGSGSGVDLDWAGNAEADLAGYNVYRAGSESGEFSKLNAGGPIQASFFRDAGAPKGTKTYYRVTAVDLAGSESAAARASAVVSKATQISLSASPALLNPTLPGSSATLSGRLLSGETPLAGKKVNLERRPLGTGVFVPVTGGGLTTDAEGNFSLAGLRPERNTQYRARFVTDAEELRSATSPTAAVDVKLLVNTGLSSNRVKLGRAVRVSGSVFPANAGTVTFNVARNGVPLTKINVPLQSSRFSRLYRPPTTGLYTVRVTLVGYPRHLVTTTARSFRVTLR